MGTLIQVEKGSHSCRTSGLSRAREDSELHSRCSSETLSGWAGYAPDSLSEFGAGEGGSGGRCKEEV